MGKRGRRSEEIVSNWGLWAACGGKDAKDRGKAHARKIMQARETQGLGIAGRDNLVKRQENTQKGFF